MNREEQLNHVLNTIHHYSTENPEGNLYAIAIQVAYQMCPEEEKQNAIQALLLGIKHFDDGE